MFWSKSKLIDPKRDNIWSVPMGVPVDLPESPPDGWVEQMAKKAYESQKSRPCWNNADEKAQSRWKRHARIHYQVMLELLTEYY